MPFVKCPKCNFKGYMYPIQGCYGKKCRLSVIPIEEPHATNPIPERASVLFIPERFHLQ